MDKRSYTAPNTDYKYGFNGMERYDEVAGNGNSYTAEFWQYDGRLGRRFNLDPVSNESLSPYSCLGNNPFIYVDKEGDVIRIWYKEKRGIARIFEKKKSWDYGTPYTGNSKFLNKAINSLDYIVNNKADINGLIEKAKTSKEEVINIKKGNSDKYNPKNKTISWTGTGAKFKNWSSDGKTSTKASISAALLLFHELAHWEQETFKNDQYLKDMGTVDDNYDNKEEARVIKDYENKAAEILGEDIRTNHDAPTGTVKNDDPTKSTDKPKSRKEKKK